MREVTGREGSGERSAEPAERTAGRQTLVGADEHTEAAKQGFSGAGTRLPHFERIQASFGRHDISSIRAHIGGRAAQANDRLGAHAYAHGEDIAFADTPDLHTAAHEAAHVVQQRSSLRIAGGIDQPGDEHERAADAIADAVVGGQSAEVLLDGARGSGSGTGSTALVQRKVNKVKTPVGLPESPPPAAIAPPAAEPQVDGEGNQIVQENGHWHLAGPPRSPTFPVAAGYRYQLLPINPNAAYAALHARVVAIQAEQLATANRLHGTGDMKYWFAKVYYYVTTHELEAIAAGTYQYPHMKMEEVAQFHAAYKANLDAWEAGNKDKVEAHWKKAFGDAESENGGTWYKLRSHEILSALLPSMQAHIRFDLPRALAACYVMHYAGIAGTTIQDFHLDFDAMAPVFDKAQESLLPEIKDDTWKVDPGRYGPMQDLGMAFIFNVPMERENTFDKAQMVSGMKQLGRSNKRTVRRMRDGINSRKPGSGRADFEVGGEDVGNDFDWMTQPGAKPDSKAPNPTYEAAPSPPPFPARLYFKQGRGQGSDKLEDAIRDDQDLAPYKALAEWTKNVRGAQILLHGHASAEGADFDNMNLSKSRAFLVRYFLWKVGADTTHNNFLEIPFGEAGALPTSPWRFVEIVVVMPGTGKQQHHAPNKNLPSETT